MQVNSLLVLGISSLQWMSLYLVIASRDELASAVDTGYYSSAIYVGLIAR